MRFSFEQKIAVNFCADGLLRKFTMCGPSILEKTKAVKNLDGNAREVSGKIYLPDA
jgi:hypothetical protein